MKWEEARQWIGKKSCGCCEAEYRWMHESVLNGSPGIVVEIGAWLGGSTIALASAAQEIGSHVVSIDTWHLGIIPGQPYLSVDSGKGPFDLFCQHTGRLVDAELRSTVTQIVSTAQQAGSILRIEDVSFLWIDGAHGYPNAMREWELFADSVVPGGIVGIHDAQDMRDAGRCICEMEQAGYFEGWQEVELPAVNSAVQLDLTSTIDHKGPWLTRAWRRHEV